ncbi:MAG: ABC transporter permease [Clostridium sp.]|nr:ABC transporter permease [Clostridium sp.]MCM1208921.1 ABC transporter permease [Ruminococcus sp.]
MKGKLIVRNIAGNLKKTLAVVFCMSLSVMLIFVAFNTYESYQQMRTLDAYDAYGKYNIILHGVDADTKDWVVKNYSDKAQIGIEGNIWASGEMLNLISCDANAIEMNNYDIYEGRMPEEKGEVAISATALYEDEFIIANYKVGDTIHLNGLDYIITGILDDFDYSTINRSWMPAICTMDSETSSYNVYLHMNNSGAYASALQNITSFHKLRDCSFFNGDKDEGFRQECTIITNYDLNMLEVQKEGGIDDANMGFLLKAMAVILFLTSMMLCVHTFLAYFNGRENQQDILTSMGFSKSYIASSYLYECLFFIVCGYALGVFVGKQVTVFMFRVIQNARIVKLDNFKPYFTEKSYLIVLCICMLAFVIGALPAIEKSMMPPEVLHDRTKSVKHNAGKEKYIRKNLMLKYYFRDNHFGEKVSEYAALLMMAMIFILSLQVEKYNQYVMGTREPHEYMFSLLTGDECDMDDMDGFEKMIPYVEYYAVTYGTSGPFLLEDLNVKEEYLDNYYTEDGYVYCGIYGTSKQEYEKKVALSQTVPYEEFAASGGAIVIDNYMSGNDVVLAELPQKVRYGARNDVSVFDAGELDIFARSSFLNWGYQTNVEFVVPDTLFKEKFDYTYAVIIINVTHGKEKQAGEVLRALSYQYDYGLTDNTSEYVNDADRNATIKLGMRCAMIFIIVINILSVVYINELKFIRRMKNLAIFKSSGYSNFVLTAPYVVSCLIKSVAAAIISTFVLFLVEKKYLPEITRNIVMRDGMDYILQTLVFMLIVTLISVVRMIILSCRQKITDDLKLYEK